MKDMEKCPDCNRTECFGCEDGRCVVLIDNNFKKMKCPFFKTREQVKQEKEYCRERRELFGIRGTKKC